MEPLRTCIVCRRVMPKKDMLRICKSSDGAVKPDYERRLPGRGAYICDDRKCAERLSKSHALDRAFKMQVDSEIYERIAMALEGNNGIAGY